MHQHFEGDKHYHKIIGFNDGISKCTKLNASEKITFKKQVKKVTENIDIEVSKFFGAADNVVVAIDNIKKRMSVSSPCPVKYCSYKGEPLKHHLTKRQHKWSNEDAALQQSFCTRMYNYITTVDKYVTSRANLCLECKLFYKRIDHHLVGKDHMYEKK